MSAKHTPGPWKYGWETPAREWAQVTTAQGNIIANVNTETGPDIPPLVSKKMPADANARLIAAAPDLLAALEGILNSECSICNNSPVWHTARAAVAKATGETA